jgi:hypothetical protein
MRCRRQRRGEPVPLRVGPACFRLVQNGHVGDIVEPQERRPPRPAQIERDCDDDATQPPRKRRRILQVVEAAERS